jgi:hypothetical protein
MLSLPAVKAHNLPMTTLMNDTNILYALGKAGVSDIF